jgi:hypothetical protein
MTHKHRLSRFVICVRNERCEVSLELRKIYQVLPDSAAERHHLLRIADESGEDYLHPEHFFLPIELPKRVEYALLALPRINHALSQLGSHKPRTRTNADEQLAGVPALARGRML